MINSKGYAGFDATSPLKAFDFQRREVGEHDVLIEIKYSGICHSDIHTVRSEWGDAHYPLVPGHEIVGEVAKIGSSVSKHKVGDLVGVGCIVNSCRKCNPCHDHLEQFCEKGTTFTYDSVDADGSITQGGYANNIVVNENYVLKAPTNLPIETIAPLLCAGITTFSPLKRWNVCSGDRVAILGLGGLGHMAVKLAKSFGAEVIVITHSEHKQKDAIRLGADRVVISQNTAAMEAINNTCDLIINTISAPHDIGLYTSLLKPQKTMCLLGIPAHEHELSAGDLILHRKIVTGSLIGGIEETQEMLDYCSKHQITADIELIPIQKVNEAYTRVLNGDVKYRFVIDMQSINK